MVRTSLCAVGTVVVLFVGAGLMPHQRAMAQRPTPSPFATFATAGSGEQGVGWTRGWSAAVSVSGDPVDTYGGGYYSNGCSATSVNGGSASFNSQLSITLENGNQGTNQEGDWWGYKSIDGYLYTSSLCDIAKSSVTGGSEPDLSDEATNPDETEYSDENDDNDICETATLAYGAQQSFSNWLTISGSAAGASN